MSPARRSRAAPSARTAATVALLLATAVGCAGLGPAAEHEKLAQANLAAREKLRYGMSREEARARMGETAVVPPWKNSRGLGPATVANPLDSLEVEAPGGDRYVVDRYAVALSGDPRCPFVRGQAELVPLIYVDGVLVGWEWDYLENALQRRLTPEERSFRFGRFCAASDADADPR